MTLNHSEKFKGLLQCQRIFYLAVILNLSFHTCAQVKANIWYFGDSAGIKFNNSGMPNAIGNSQMKTGEGSAVVTNNKGELLFYTDGVSVWNSKHSVDITGMKGSSSSTQSALIIPVPETDCKRYFIFTTGGVEDFSAGANVSLVEVTGDPQISGTTIQKIEGPTRMFISSCTEKLNGVMDGQGGYWVVNHEWGNNVYHTFHVTVNTTDVSKLIATDVVSAIGKSQKGIITNGQGQLKFGRNGSKMAAAIAEDKFVEIYDFNISTGVISNVQLIQNNDPNFPTVPTVFSGFANLYGLEFSNSGQLLYVAECFTGSFASVFQFDLASANLGVIRNSRVVLGTSSHSSRYPYGAMQMGPDGKIYIARTGRNFLGIIQNPELTGISCNFAENGFTLLNNCFNGLPNTIATYACCSLEASFGRDTFFCQNQSVMLIPKGKQYKEYLWMDMSTKPFLNVDTAGRYWLQVTDSNDCHYTDSFNVSSPLSPKVDLGNDKTFCDSINLTVSIGKQSNGESYYWSTGGRSATETFTKEGLYWVMVTNECGTARDTVQFTIAQGPKVELGNDTLVCGDFELVLDAANPGSRYLWQPNGEKSGKVFVGKYGSYSVTVTDTNGCKGFGQIEIGFGSNELKLSNVFTPNGDGLNDAFDIHVTNPDLYKLAIFNRWGEIVYQSIVDGIGDDGINWNGYYRNGTILLPEGPYFYIFETSKLCSGNGEKQRVNGTVTLIRGED